MLTLYLGTKTTTTDSILRFQARDFAHRPGRARATCWQFENNPKALLEICRFCRWCVRYRVSAYPVPRNKNRHHTLSIAFPAEKICRRAKQSTSCLLDTSKTLCLTLQKRCPKLVLPSCCAKSSWLTLYLMDQNRRHALSFAFPAEKNCRRAKQSIGYLLGTSKTLLKTGLAVLLC